MAMPILAVHLADGQVSMMPVAGAWILCISVLVATCWKLSEEEAPAVALFAGVFFLGSLLSIPVPGGPKTHLLLTGMLGVMLGAKAFPAILVGCAMQALLFAHGGPASIAINTLVMGLPAMVLGSIGRMWVARSRTLGMVRAAGFATGAGTAILTVILHSGTLLLWGQGAWATSAAALVAIHIPLVVVEGVVSAAVVGLVWRARPGMLGFRESGPVVAALFLVGGSTQAGLAWHRLEVEAHWVRGGIEVVARFSADHPAGAGEASLQDREGRERYRVSLADGRARFPDVDSGHWLVRVWASDHYGETILEAGEQDSTNARWESRLNWVAALAGSAMLLSIYSILRTRRLERMLTVPGPQSPGEKPVGNKSDKGSSQSPSPT